VVLALPPDRAADLIASLDDPALAGALTLLRRIDYAPIATVYLRYAAGTRLPAPYYALAAAPQRQQFGQWVFDRGALDARCDGILGVVISGRGPHMDLERHALCDAIARQIGSSFSLPAPLDAVAIVEKRAAILPSPNLQRPAVCLPMPGLFLASDAADSPYPSTIEGSVRTGLTAAEALIHGA
jgi:hypothetical protein